MPRALQLLMRTPEQTLVEMLVFEAFFAQTFPVPLHPTLDPSPSRGGKMAEVVACGVNNISQVGIPGLEPGSGCEGTPYWRGCWGSEQRERRRQRKVTPDQVRGGQWGGRRSNRHRGATWKVRTRLWVKPEDDGVFGKCCARHMRGHVQLAGVPGKRRRRDGGNVETTGDGSAATNGGAKKQCAATKRGAK
jgi:hypothetical protein